MSRPKGSGRKPLCHPDKPHHGHGECIECYHANRRQSACKRAIEHYHKNKAKRLDAIYAATLVRVYGITVQDYERMFTAQGGVCAMCLKPPKIGRFKRLHVDHDHATGRVRGLLCRGCNGLIGWYEHHKDALHDYLKEPHVS